MRRPPATPPTGAAVEAEVDRLVTEWLAAHAGAPPTEPDLVTLVRTAFPLHAPRRLADAYARGFIHGWALAEERERRQRATDLALIRARAVEQAAGAEGLVALVAALSPPEPPTGPEVPRNRGPPASGAVWSARSVGPRGYIPSPPRLRDELNRR